MGTEFQIFKMRKLMEICFIIMLVYLELVKKIVKDG